MNKNSIAFGAPGIEPRWTSSAKDGIGTAYHSSSRIWFTLSHGENVPFLPEVEPRGGIQRIDVSARDIPVRDGRERSAVKEFSSSHLEPDPQLLPIPRSLPQHRGPR
jgi:hypothetical protein